MRPDKRSFSWHSLLFHPLTGAAFNLSLLAGWVWLYRSVYSYLGIIFTRQEFRTNQIVLLMILSLIIWRVRRGEMQFNLGKLPQLHPAALALALGGSVLFLLAERFLDINTLSASLFGLASYGLLGLWLHPARWRQGLPAALLIVGTLPFGEHLDTFIGYPVRIFTAALVRDGLNGLGIESVGIDTILVFENGISQVDIPCSGVKSLWTGGLFLLAATWIEGRRINLRWLLIALLFVILLLAANLARVGILVLVGQVAGWRMLAEMLHVPLGMLGFGAACAAALALLRWSGKEPLTRPIHLREASHQAIQRPAWLAPLLLAAVAGMGLLYTPRPQPALAAPEAANWRFPNGLSTKAWPLTQGELDWLTGEGAQSAERWRFSWQGRNGSLLIVSSASWRGHHRPERCFEVYGLIIQNSYAHLAAPVFPVRVVSLGEDRQDRLFSAAYWFQSAETTTDDYAARIWADLSPEKQRWQLITVLFDDTVDPTDSISVELYAALRSTVQDHLKGKAQP